MVGSARFIIQSGMTLLYPPFEDLIHPMSRGLQIGSNSRDGPPFGMQIDNGPSSLIGVGDLRIQGISPGGHAGLGAISEHPLNGVVGELAAKPHKANGRDFP